jgi:hypothetical protein
LLELSIIALGEEDGAHAAAADLAHEAERTHALGETGTGQRAKREIGRVQEWSDESHRRRVEKRSRGFLRPQKLVDVSPQIWVVRAGGVDERAALRRRQVQCSVEQCVGLSEPLGRLALRSRMIFRHL